MADRAGDIKCPSCGKRIDPIVWGMCQGWGNCYHCGADIPTLTLDALTKALAGSAN